MSNKKDRFPIIRLAVLDNRVQKQCLESIKFEGPGGTNLRTG
jgi:hypothetical protein